MEPKDKPKIEFSTEAATKFAAQYADKQFRVFTSDQLVEAFNRTHEPPKDARIWGPIFTAMKLEGRIKAHGARMIKPHNCSQKRYATEWISKTYSDQQSQNRTIPTNQIHIPFDGRC